MTKKKESLIFVLTKDLEIQHKLFTYVVPRGATVTATKSGERLYTIESVSDVVGIDVDDKIVRRPITEFSGTVVEERDLLPETNAPRVVFICKIVFKSGFEMLYGMTLPVYIGFIANRNKRTTFKFKSSLCQSDNISEIDTAEIVTFTAIESSFDKLNGFSLSYGMENMLSNDGDVPPLLDVIAALGISEIR